MASSAVTFNLKGTASGFRSSMRGAGAAAAGFSSRIRRTGSSLLRLGGLISTLQTNMLGLQGAFAAFRGVSSSIRAVASFEEGLLKIRAVSGATQPQMRALTKLIEKLGIETQFSVKDISAAIFNLSTLGIKGPEAFKRLIPSVVTAATALDIDLNTAATLVLSTIKTFNLELKDASRVTDLLANAYTNSALNAEKFAIANQFAGLAAKAFGRGLEDILPLLMSLADSNIDASIAGTQIRSSFLRLIKPSAAAVVALKEMGLTVKDVDVASLGFIGVLKRLEKAGISTAQSVAVFGLRGAPIIQALLKAQQDGLKGTALLDRYQRSVLKSGEASRQTAQRQQGLSFAFKQVSASVEILSANIGKVISSGLGLESIVLGIVKSLGDMTVFLKDLDFSKLKAAGIEIFSPDELIKNLDVVFTSILPKAVDLAASAALFGGASLLEFIGSNFPALIKSMGNLSISILMGGGKAFAVGIVKLFQFVFNLTNRIINNLLRSTGRMLASIPGLGGVGSKLTQIANVSDIASAGFSRSITRFSKEVGRNFDAVSFVMKDSFGKFVDIANEQTGASKSIVRQVQEFKKANALNMNELGRKSEGITSALAGVPTSAQRAALREALTGKKTAEPGGGIKISSGAPSSVAVGISRIETASQRKERISREISVRAQERQRKFQEEMERQSKIRQAREKRIEELRFMAAVREEFGGEFTPGGGKIDNRGQIIVNYRQPSRSRALFGKTREVNPRGDTQPKKQGVD